MKYGLYDSDGDVVHVGLCPDGEEQHQADAHPGLALYLGEINKWDRVNLATGERIIVTEPVKTYTELRVYPAIGAQLDMLWHAMNNGEIPKATAWFDQIQTIKNRYPKG